MNILEECNNDYDILHSITHLCIGSLLYICQFYSKIKIFEKIKILIFYYIILYQGCQQFFNIRIFIPEKKIKKGIVISHTLRKLSEHLVGYLLIAFIFKILKF